MYQSKYQKKTEARLINQLTSVNQQRSTPIAQIL